MSVVGWGDRDRALFDVVEAAQAWHPRSRQVTVGPSGLGDPCDRGLLRKLSGDREPRSPYEGWKATVGTAVHAWLADAMTAENERLGRVRWVTERSVLTGEYAGRRVWGTADLYDVDEGVVYDWKTKSAARLRAEAAAGPGATYRVQANLYGRGYALLGLPVNEVAVVSVPRDGELTSSRVWRAPYDETVAVDALTRAGRFQGVLDAAGGDWVAAVQGMPTCTDRFCEGCPVVPRSMFD